MRYQAVIFDLYGTLVDGPTGLEGARVEMASALGVGVAEFEDAWRSFRRRRDSGELASVEAAIEAAMERLGVKSQGREYRSREGDPLPVNP